MLAFGQPKMHAEYILATSRVGRSDDRPGLVVALLKVHKPRDRSHYERFRHYHETFCRSVEPASVTPFSARALDRGFADALVALARHLERMLTPPRGVERIGGVRAALETRLLEAFVERVQQEAFAGDDEREEAVRSVHDQSGGSARLVAPSARRLPRRRRGDAVPAPRLRRPKALLREMLEEGFESAHQREFRVNRPLRDVEPEVNLYLHDLCAAPAIGGRVRRKAHGQVRRSQVITTYGPGALIDLPQESAIVTRLDEWPPPHKLEEIDEPRLARKLQATTGIAAPRLLAPPSASSDPGAAATGIGAWRFPEWCIVLAAAAEQGAGRTRSRRLVLAGRSTTSAASRAGRRWPRASCADARAGTSTTTRSSRRSATQSEPPRPASVP